RHSAVGRRVRNARTCVRGDAGPRARQSGLRRLVPPAGAVTCCARRGCDSEVAVGEDTAALTERAARGMSALSTIRTYVALSTLAAGACADAQLVADPAIDCPPCVAWNAPQEPFRI